MRMTSRLFLAGMLGFAATACVPPGDTEVGVSAQFGPGIDVYDYDPGYFGAWQSDYMMWTPSTVYVLNGRFYGSPVRGARAVAVYRYHDRYFLPPRDRSWEHKDQRYDYHNQPKSKDYQHARPRAPRPGNGRGGGH